MYDDPFTAGERILMIHSALLDSKIAAERFYVVPIINYENNSTWYAHLSSFVPEFHVLYTGNEFVRCLVRTRIDVKTPAFAKRRKYNGTNIRNLIAHKMPWEHLVPSRVAILMEKVDGLNRIRTLFKVKNPINPSVYPKIK